MKLPPEPVPGTTRSCSFTSCYYENISCINSFLKRMINLGPEASRDSGKYLTPRERKLLDDLMAQYDKFKSEILSGINSNEQYKDDGKPRTHRKSDRKDMTNAVAVSAGAMLELVKLINKSQALRNNEFSESCSCCICNSSICSHYKRQRHRHGSSARANYSSKSNLSRHDRVRNKKALRLKEKNVCSDPCTCTSKLSSVITIESKESNTLLHPTKPLSMNINAINFAKVMNYNRLTKKYLKQIRYSESGMSQSVCGSMKILNRKIREEVKQPFRNITVLIKESKSKESLLKNDEIIKSNSQFEQRVGDCYKETRDNTNLLTSGGLVINTKTVSNEDTPKKINFSKSNEIIIRPKQKSAAIIGKIEPASKRIVKLMQVSKSPAKTSITAGNIRPTVKLSRNAKHRQEKARPKTCQYKLLAQYSQENKIQNKKNITSKHGKVQAKSREIKYWPSYPKCLSDECTSQDCYNLLSLRKARLVETPCINRLNIKEIIEKTVSELGTPLNVVKHKIKRKTSKNNGAVTSFKDVSKIFLDIEEKEFVKSYTVGICNQSTHDLKKGTKNKVLSIHSLTNMESSTSKSADNASQETFIKIKKLSPKSDKKDNSPKQIKNKEFEFVRTLQQEQTVASGNIDFKSASKSLSLNNDYSHFSFKSLNSITFSGSNLINLLKKNSATKSYIPRCFCTTNSQVPVTDTYHSGHSSDFNRCKVCISACKTLILERQSDSKFSDKTKGSVSMVSAQSPLHDKIVESQVQANSILYSTFEVSPFTNIQSIYQCQPVKCPNMNQIVHKLQRSKSCLVPHKCESHLSVPIECDPNKCLEVVIKKALKSKSHSIQSLREAISKLNIACPCKCQKCQVAPPPPKIQCQRNKNEIKLKSLSKCTDRFSRASTSSASSRGRRDQSRVNILSACESHISVAIECDPNKCLNVVTKKVLRSKFHSSQSLRETIPELNIACPCKSQKCTVALVAPSNIQCQQNKSDEKLKKSQSKCPERHGRESSTSTANSQGQRNQLRASVSSSQGIRLTCIPRPSQLQKLSTSCPVQSVSDGPGLLATTILFIRRCICRKTLKEHKDMQQCPQMLKSEKRPLEEKKVKVTRNVFECDDRNSVSSGSTTTRSKKSKVTNSSARDSRHQKEFFGKKASSKQAFKICSNYSFEVEFCKNQCSLSNKNSSAVNNTVLVERKPNNHALAECKWELLTPPVSQVVSNTGKHSKNPSVECDNSLKNSLKYKSCKKKKHKKSSSLDIYESKQPNVNKTDGKEIELVKCPSVKFKSRPQKPQKSITVLTVCKGKKTCTPVKSKMEKSSKNVSVSIEKRQTTCQSVKCDCKPALNCKCKTQQSKKGIKVSKKNKSTQAEGKSQPMKPNKTTSLSKNSKNNIPIKRSAIECKYKPTVPQKSATVSKAKVKVKCFSSVECECKQIDSHNSVAVRKKYKQIKCMPINCECKSTELNRSATVGNEKANTKCRPSVGGEYKHMKPHKSTSVCKNCKGKKQLNRKLLICECKPVQPHKRVAVTGREKKRFKHCEPLTCECKPIELHKSGTAGKKNKQFPCPSVECECKHIKLQRNKDEKNYKCPPLICECKCIKEPKNKCLPLICECKSIKETKNKCIPLICECKSIKEPLKRVPVGVKNKHIIYCPSVECECTPLVKCECRSEISGNKTIGRAQQLTMNLPLECECSSEKVICRKDKNKNKSITHSQVEAKIRQLINAGISLVTRYYNKLKPEAKTHETKKLKTKKHKTTKHKTKKHKTKKHKAKKHSKKHKTKKHEIVCPNCGYKSKASQTSSKKTKSSSKKNQARQHKIDEVDRKSKDNKKIKSSKHKVVFSESKSSSSQNWQKRKGVQYECEVKTENRSVKSFFMKILRKFTKNKMLIKYTTTAESKNVQSDVPRGKTNTKGKKLTAYPSQAPSNKVKHSQKQLRKTGSRGDKLSKKSNTTSTCCSEATQCSMKPQRANEINSVYRECNLIAQQHFKSKSSVNKSCKHKRCYANIGDTGPMEKHCYCSSKSCKNALSRKNIHNCHQVYHFKTQPTWNACHNRMPLNENVPNEFNPGFFVSTQNNRDVSKEITSRIAKRMLLKSQSQMVDVKTETKSSAVGRASTRRLCTLEIQNADNLRPTITVGKLAIEEDRINNQKRCIPAMPSPQLYQRLTPNEISTILPYTPRNKLKRKNISRKRVSKKFNDKQQIDESSEKCIKRKRLHRSCDVVIQKSKRTEKRKVIPPLVKYKSDQAKVKIKQPIASGITKFVNICTSFLSRQKKTPRTKPDMYKCHDNRKYNLYQTASLKIPCKKRHSLVENMICTSSKSDSQPTKLAMIQTKKPKSLANPKIQQQKSGTIHHQDLTLKQQIKTYSHYQSGDACWHVLNLPDICINNKYPDIQNKKDILNYLCKPQLDTEKRSNPYTRDYIVGYAFKSKKQKHGWHHPCTSGVQSSSRGFIKDVKSEKEDKDCNTRCTGLKMKGILKKKAPQKTKMKRKHLKSNSMSCCEICCEHKKLTKAPKRTDGKRGPTSKSAAKRKLNKKYKITKTVGVDPCDSTCLVNLTREGRVKEPKKKILKPLKLKKTCRDACRHMKRMQRVEKKKLKTSLSQTNKKPPRSSSSILRSVNNCLVGKTKSTMSRQKSNPRPDPLFEIQLDSKDYRVLNKEQTIYSIAEWQKKEMERLTAEARHGKNCRCCICVRSALQQTSRTRKRNDKTDIILKEPSTVECVCGSAVCAKERKKMIAQLEQEISRHKPQQKPCVCGSKICAREAEIAIKGKITGKVKEKGKVKKEKEKKHKKKKEKKEKKKKEKKKVKKKEKKQKKPDKDKKKREMEKAQEKLQRKEEKRKEKLEKEKEKKEMKKSKKPKKTARELLDDRMKKFSDARKKDYENWQKSREFKQNNKYEVAARERHKYYVAKMNRLESHATQERSEPDMQLVAKSLADIWDVSATCVQSAARHSYRRIMQPEPKEKHIKRQNYKTNQYVIRTTFRNIQRRLLLTKLFGFIGKLGGGSNRYRRRRKSPESWGCNMYMQTLRVKRCVWLYKTCPWFYPYCLNIITVWKHFAFFLMFFLGIILWTPLFICAELCNLVVCCNC